MVAADIPATVKDGFVRRGIVAVILCAVTLSLMGAASKCGDTCNPDKTKNCVRDPGGFGQQPNKVPAEKPAPPAIPSNNPDDDYAAVRFYAWWEPDRIMHIDWGIVNGRRHQERHEDGDSGWSRIDIVRRGEIVSLRVRPDGRDVRTGVTACSIYVDGALVTNSAGTFPEVRVRNMKACLATSIIP